MHSLIKGLFTFSSVTKLLFSVLKLYQITIMTLDYFVAA